jgi:hypothetical protein
MPSIREVVMNDGKGQSIIRLNAMNAAITLPPFMRIASYGNNLATEQEVLKADCTKMYVLHGYQFSVSNTGATTCTSAGLFVTDMFNGVKTAIDGLDITASTVNSAYARMTGLNLPLSPGTGVTVTVAPAAPSWCSVKIYYTEVDI